MARSGLTRPTLLGSWVCLIFLLVEDTLKLYSVTDLSPFFFLADVISIPKTNENYRLLYDTKGRFRLHPIRDEDAKVRLIPFRYISLYSSCQ